MIEGGRVVGEDFKVGGQLVIDWSEYKLQQGVSGSDIDDSGVGNADGDDLWLVKNF